MTVKELYNLKKYECIEYGLKDRPGKLLGMLLLSEMDDYEPLIVPEGEFYNTYKKQINNAIEKVEKDFCFGKEDIINIIEETFECEDYDYQRIWDVYSEGFSALHWGLLYAKDKTPEEVFSKYFRSTDLEKHYSMEELTISKNIQITSLETLIDRVVSMPEEIYTKIGKIMTLEEKAFIINSISNKDCNNCTNENCIRDSFNNNCTSWENDELIGRIKVLKL